MIGLSPKQYMILMIMIMFVLSSINIAPIQKNTPVRMDIAKNEGISLIKQDHRTDPLSLHNKEEFGIFRREGNLGPLSVPSIQKGGIRQARQWTFMVYMDGDNDLESAAIDDFLEMSSVGSTADVAIIVLFDRWNGAGDPYDDTSYGDWTDANIFYITAGMEPYSTNAEQNWGEVNMGDPQTIVDFVTWCVNNYPADKYALILWDHGGGLSGVCWDYDNGSDNINLYELRNALETIYNNLGIKIDILGFDACLMGMIEVAYQCRDFVDYVVFSQEYEPGDGWPYDDILSYLVSNPTTSPANLAATIAQKYVQSYNWGSQGYDPNATQSAINISALEKNVFRKLDRLIGELLRNYDTYSGAISNAIDNTETFYYSNEKDLIHFLMLLRDRVSDVGLIGLIEETIDAINESILYGGHLSGHSNAYGLSANFPSYYYSSYDNILMSVHHQWDEFIRKQTGNDVDVWFYDITFVGSDSDGNGYFDSGTVYVDLDSDYSMTLYVEVYGSDGGSEKFMGSSTEGTISGSSSSDQLQIDLEMPTVRGIYSLRFEVYDSSDTLIDELYYYCDDNVSDIPLEYMSGYPSVKIVSPSPESTIYGDVLIEVNATDPDGISWVRIKIGSTWYDMQYNTTSGYYEYSWDTTYYDDGSFTIVVNASDTRGNITSITATYIIDNLNISIINPTNNAIISGTIGIMVNITPRTPSISVAMALARLENDTHAGPNIQLVFNTTSGLYEGDIDTTQYADGDYYLVICANNTNGGRDIVRISVIVDNNISIDILYPLDGEYLNTASVTVRWSVEDGVDVDHFEVRIDYGSWINVGLDTSHEFTGLLEGVHQVDVKVVDTEGRIGSDSVKFYIDLTSPSIELLSPTNNSYMNTRDVRLEWDSSDNFGIDHFDIRIDDGSWINIGSSSSYDCRGLDEGVHKIYIRAVDRAGNSIVIVVRIFVDLTAPIINIIEPQNNSVIPTTEVTIIWSIEENFEVEDVIVIVDNTQVINVDYVSNVTIENLSEGTHRITIRAIDKAGNVGESTIHIEIHVETTTEKTTEIPRTFMEEIAPYISILVITIITIMVIVLLSRKKRY